MKKMILSSALLLSATAFADVEIYPGETRYVSSGQYVTCVRDNGGGHPQPPPVRYINVSPNRNCLETIGQTDGRSMANRAASCDSINLRRYGVDSNCSLRYSRLNRRLFDNVYSKRTSLLHPNQIAVLEDACSEKEYECR